MTALDRRSPLSVSVQEHPAVPGALRDSPVPRIADIGPLPRRLLVGAGVEAFLEAAGMPFPPPFGSVHAGGFDLVRSGRRQCLAIGRVAPLDVPAATPAVTVLELDQCEVLIAPIAAPDALLADICPTELAPFGAGVCIPVALAGVDSWLRRADSDGWRITCAPADGPYLFDILHAIVCEHGGGTAGFDDAITWLEQSD